VDGVGDLSQDGTEIVENLLIRESKHYVVMAFEVGIAVPVVGLSLLPFMDLPVKLHDHPSIAAAEVRNEWTYGVLAEKFQPVKPPIPEMLPKELLRWGLVPSQLSRLLTGGSHPHSSRSLSAHVIATLHAFLPLSR
jgi:hypothetical protein